jgi:hypothetical protein
MNALGTGRSCWFMLVVQSLKLFVMVLMLLGGTSLPAGERGEMQGLCATARPLHLELIREREFSFSVWASILHLGT